MTLITFACLLIHLFSHQAFTACKTLCWWCGFIVGDMALLCAKLLQSCPTLCDLWTVAHQAPLAMRFSRQEFWSGQSCSPPGGLPDPGTEPTSLTSCFGRWDRYHQHHLGCPVALLGTGFQSKSLLMQKLAFSILTVSIVFQQHVSSCFYYFP